MKQVTIVLGAQWGDEGKGKLVDVLSQEMDICCRCAGGDNAGHTVVVDGTTYHFHIIPSGIINPKCIGVLGNGVVINPQSFLQELQELERKGLDLKSRIIISDRAHVTFDYHIMEDKFNDKLLGKNCIGTTQRGIGPTYMQKSSRIGIRMYEFVNKLYHECYRENVRLLRKSIEIESEYNEEERLKYYDLLADKIRPYVRDTLPYIARALSENKKILVEGANGLLLDVDFGTYPYVTSSSTCTGGALMGLGIPLTAVGEVLGVFKAYSTRVGNGPMPTELKDDIGASLGFLGNEKGVTTGRSRRCGWLDIVSLRYSCQVNCYTCLNMTKLDIFDTFKAIKIAVAYRHKGQVIKDFPSGSSVLQECEPIYEEHAGWLQKTSKCTKYEELPENAKKYIKRVEESLNGVKIAYVGVNPDRSAIIVCPGFSLNRHVI